jgi:protein-L-isoaspartate(D-aspartate) O-methyltransferase
MVAEQLERRGITDPRVLEAMGTVPREAFTDADDRKRAYEDIPIQIGWGQTISQPYMVALICEAAALRSGNRVLDVGTGSGYQAAVLAELAGTVYTVEIVEPLAREAARRLATLGYRNVVAKVGDGYQGWPEHAPFDSIMVTAAPREVPQPLIEQLKPGGRLVVPVGGQAAGQELLLIQKQPDGRVTRRTILAVRFVPLIDQSGKQQ